MSGNVGFIFPNCNPREEKYPQARGEGPSRRRACRRIHCGGGPPRPFRPAGGEKTGRPPLAKQGEKRKEPPPRFPLSPLAGRGRERGPLPRQRKRRAKPGERPSRGEARPLPAQREGRREGAPRLSRPVLPERPALPRRTAPAPPWRRNGRRAACRSSASPARSAPASAGAPSDRCRSGNAPCPSAR